MATEEQISQQQEHLALLRRKLVYNLQQQREQGGSAPFSLVEDIRRAREDILRIKVTLRGWDVEVEDESDDEAATTTSTIRQIKSHAVRAYYRQQWSEAERLLAQAHDADPADLEIERKLREVQHRFIAKDLYQDICAMRQENRWQTALASMDDFSRHYPDAGDPEGVRVWAERQFIIHRVHAAQANHNLDDLGQALDTLIRAYPDDETIDLFEIMLAQYPNGELPIHPNTAFARLRYLKQHQRASQAQALAGVAASPPEASLEQFSSSSSKEATSNSQLSLPIKMEVEVKIGRQVYQREESGRGYYSIVGELVNESGVIIYDPMVTVTFYDNDDAIISFDVTSVDSKLKCLEPQGQGSFHYFVYGSVRDMDRIVRKEIVAAGTIKSNGWISLPFEERDAGPYYRDVVVHNPHDYDVQGFQMIVATYDEVGNVHETWSDYVGNRLYSDGQWTFSLNKITHSYRIQVEGRRA